MKKMSLKIKLKQKYAKPLQQELFTTNGQDIFQQETSTIWRIFTQPQRKHMTEGKLKTLKNKEAMRYLRVCFQMMWGVRNPYNDAHFIAIFWLFDSVKIRCKTSEKQWANFVPNKSSKQTQMFVLDKHFTALSGSAWCSQECLRLTGC